LLLRRRSPFRRPISDSAEVPRDLDLVDSTLHETLVTDWDATTVDALRPHAIRTLAVDRFGFDSLA
jgi:hypothetical protein